MPAAQRGTIRDLSGNGRDLTIYGRPVVAFDGAFGFGFFQLTANNPQLTPTVNGTREFTCWIYPNSPAADGVIVGAGEETPEGLVLTAARRLQYRQASGSSLISAALTNAAWSHIRVRFTKAGAAGSIQAWVNGIAQDAVSVALGSMSGKVNAIGSSESPAVFLKARLQSMAFWSRALSDVEAQSLYDYPCMFMQSNFGGALHDAYAMKEGTGSSLASVVRGAGAVQVIGGATWELGANGGQAWTDWSGGAADSFAASSRSFSNGHRAHAVTPASFAGGPDGTIVVVGVTAGDMGDNEYLVHWGQSGTTGLHICHTTAPTAQWQLKINDAVSAYEVSDDLAAGSIAATWTGGAPGSGVLWINGVKGTARPADETLALNNASLTVMADQPRTAGRYLSGSVREVMLFNRALGDAELKSLLEQRR